MFPTQLSVSENEGESKFRKLTEMRLIVDVRQG